MRCAKCRACDTCRKEREFLRGFALAANRDRANIAAFVMHTVYFNRSLPFGFWRGYVDGLWSAFGA